MDKLIIKAEDYKPKEKGKSDFYSWNLYRWIKKNSGKKCRIFKTSREYTPLVIGWKDSHGSVIGFRLKELCRGFSVGKFPQQFCYGDQDLPEVTEEFYKEYKRIGVCAIHGDAAHDWEVTDSEKYRICKRCEKVQEKIVTMVESVSWEAVK